MEVLKYETEVIKWEESPWESYKDLNANMGFGLMLSAPDKEDDNYSYFAVSPQLKVTNGDGHAVFIGETKITIRLKNHGIAPTPEVLFEIIVEATREFGKIFKERTEHNPRIYHAIPKPLFTQVEGIIADCLNSVYPAN